MIGFGLLCGHLLGDYIFQNDWQASNKTNPRHNGHRPGTWVYMDGGGCQIPGTLHDAAVWDETHRKWLIGHLACTIHCLLYTLAVFLCSFWWMPWWGLLACFLVHWPIDRFRLARIWMERVSSQKVFATGPLAPWSIVVVDNTFHLLALFVIGLLAVGY